MGTDKPLVGIDYGSKLAGATGIAWSFNRQEVSFVQSKKREDADAFIRREVARLQPAKIHIDAPLSLPGVYKNIAGYENFFYRQADRALGAMSPLFLGGLTARAIQLTAGFAVDKIACLEVYPAALARELSLKTKGYKKEESSFSEFLVILCKRYRLKLPADLPLSWYCFDALLALITGLRIEQQGVKFFGNAAEGFIYV
jgi:predicted nuclease with RNAse H fold